MSKDLTKIKTSWLLPKDLVKQLKQYALDHDTSATTVLDEALRDFLARNAKK